MAHLYEGEKDVPGPHVEEVMHPMGDRWECWCDLCGERETLYSKFEWYDFRQGHKVCRRKAR